MNARPNPLKLNPLQLKTLAILQALAREPGFAEPPDVEGMVRIRAFPVLHGDHLHIGRFLVRAKDATGLTNRNVFEVLARKGLILPGPVGEPVLTPKGLAYETGIAADILHESGH